MSGERARGEAAQRAAVESFFHLAGEPLAGHACRGLACFAARARAPERWQRAQDEPRLYCLGRCHAAPAAADDDPPAHAECQAREAVLLHRVLAGGATHLARYIALGGGAARAMAPAPETLLQALAASQLRGRGGAGFAAAAKWQAVARHAGGPKYVVANADEGDAGAFSDRLLIERDPFRLIEGMWLAARAVGATAGYVYLRREYPQAHRILAGALDEARAAGWLGPAFDITLVAGEGSYVAGEETAMLNAIEGRRAEPRLRPPQVCDVGLFGAPTLVHNVETLCAAPWIVEHGGAAYAALGFSSSRGTKLVSLNSMFRRPGVHEIEFGLSLRQIVEHVGGGLVRGRLTALMVGGPLAGLLPPALLDTPFGFEELAAVGGAVGHGGIIAFDETSPIRAIAAEVLAFGAYESCGQCVPCHRGTPQLARACAGGTPPVAASFDAIVEALARTSLCGHGRGLAEFARSLQRHFPEEIAPCRA